MQNPSLSITATLADVQLVQNLIEELAARRYSPGSINEVLPGWESVETSSITADASGDINFSGNADAPEISFTTGFLFTCIKVKARKYKLAWTSSLS